MWVAATSQRTCEPPGGPPVVIRPSSLSTTLFPLSQVLPFSIFRASDGNMAYFLLGLRTLSRVWRLDMDTVCGQHSPLTSSIPAACTEMKNFDRKGVQNRGAGHSSGLQNLIMHFLACTLATVYSAPSRSGGYASQGWGWPSSFGPCWSLCPPCGETALRHRCDRRSGISGAGSLRVLSVGAMIGIRTGQRLEGAHLRGREHDA